jgi:hypothetical protein
MLDQSERVADAPAKALWMRQREIDDASGQGTRVVQDEEVETRDALCQDAESDRHVAEAGSLAVEPPVAGADWGTGDCPATQAGTELHFQTDSVQAPRAASELLNRIGFRLSAYEQDAAKQTSDEQIAASLNQPPAESPLPVHADAVTSSAGRGAPLTAAADEEDESIDACITRFMQRISSPQARVETLYLPPGTADAPANQQIDRPADSADQQKCERLEAAALLTKPPRPSARPMPANLSAMRELARDQARSALDVHFRRTLLRTSIEQVLVIVSSLAGGLFCLLLSSHAPMAFLPAMVGFAVAIVWSAQCATTLVQLVGERPRTNLVVEPKTDAAAR